MFTFNPRLILKKIKLFPVHCAKKKSYCSDWKKREENTVHLLHQQTTAQIKSVTVHHQWHPSAAAPLPSAAPQPITAVDPPPPRRPLHQPTDPCRFTTSDTDQRHLHSRPSTSATKPATTTHKPPATATHKPTTASTDWWFTAARAAQQIFVCHHPQCPRLQQRQRFNKPPSSSDITDITTLSSHRRSQAES